MADDDSTSSRMPANASAVRNALRLVTVLRVLLPEYRTLRRYVAGMASDGAPNHLSVGQLCPCDNAPLKNPQEQQ